MMNLKLVTFIPDGTQFLVDAEFNENAFEYALEANLECGDMEEVDLREETNYDIEDVDLNLLAEICKRGDYRFTTGRAIVFND